MVPEPSIEEFDIIYRECCSCEFFTYSPVVTPATVLLSTAVAFLPSASPYSIGVFRLSSPSSLT